LDRLSLPHFSLSNTPALQVFKDERLLSTITGISIIPDLKLVRLACLLSERWLDEDVFNALLELIFLRHRFGVLATAAMYPPMSLFLPTSFFTDARTLYQTDQGHPSLEILRLRHRVMTKNVGYIGFAVVDVDGTHFTAFYHKIGTTHLVYGDSLGGEPPVDVLLIFNWAFSGALREPVETVVKGEVSRQGGTFGGEGSCGLSSLNFVEMVVNPSLNPWSGVKSATFRDAALEDLVQYHAVAKSSRYSSEIWFHEQDPDPCSFSRICAPDGPWGYNDFNVKDPRVCQHSYLPKDCSLTFLLQSYAHPMAEFARSPITALQSQTRASAERHPPVPHLGAVKILTICKVAAESPSEHSSDQTGFGC